MLRPGLTIPNRLRGGVWRKRRYESSHKCIKYHQGENSPNERLPVTEENTNIRQHILVFKS